MLNLGSWRSPAFERCPSLLVPPTGKVCDQNMKRPVSVIESVRLAGLFPCESEIARRLSQTPEEWAAKAPILERDGLPRIDPIMGGRHWPSVVAYFDRRYGLTSIDPVHHLDGAENLDALA
jgi:hypothetical protein